MIKDWKQYPDGKEKYQLYLASREWAVLREKVRARSGGTCERCRNDAAAQVHHQTYERKYREDLGDLVHLCAPCHEYLSGKQRIDPIWDAPALLCGSKVRSVYLAGKITGTRWRAAIAPQWAYENHSAVGAYLANWGTAPNFVPTGIGPVLDFTGPYWFDFDETGHGTSTDARGVHAFAYGKGKNHERAFNDDLLDVCSKVRTAIRNSDLVFAWIDSPDCYGTLIEIGYAKAMGKLVAVAKPEGFDAAQFWLAFAMAHVKLEADSPDLAWKGLWTKDESERCYYQLGSLDNLGPFDTEFAVKGPFGIEEESP